MKKFIALLLALTLVLSSTVALAAFPDLEEERWDWARTEIDEMTDKGIIAGYPDGNFGPADGVTKLQSLLLMARIMGYYEDEMKQTVEKAKELYSGVIAPYKVSNPDEVAFLMYYGIISEDELADYLSNAGGEILKRYEAAIILTKTAGAEDEVLSGSVTALKYEDTPDIPSSARRYVNYVTEQGYMVGMTETTFEPETNVTRAQIAVMLYRIMKKLNVSYLSGNFVSVDGSAFTLVKDGSHSLFTIPTSETQIRINGELGKKEDIPVNGYTVIKYFGDTAMYIDAFSPVIDETIVGEVTSLSTGTAKKLNISPIDGSDSVTVTVDDAAVVTLGGSKSYFNEIKKGDTVTVSVEGGIGKTIDIALREEVISGTRFKYITYEPYATVTFVTSSGEEMTKALSDDISVSRNNKTAEIRELLDGDRAIITLKKGLVTQIKATSSKSEATGTIEEIHLSSSPYMVIKSSGDSTRYNIANDVEVMIDETASTIYDLRIGAYVTVNIESDTVKSITTTVETAVAANTIVGTVENINQSYYFFYITTASERVQVFVKKNGTTKYIDSSDGSTVSFSKLKEGSTVLVTGTKQLDGSYVATAVVVMTSAQ